MSEELKAASLDPDTFVGTGFLEDKVATIKEWSFVMYDFEGHADEELPCLKAVMTLEGSDKDRNEYWKMGNADKCAPTKDGKGIGLLTSKGLSNASKGYLLLKSMTDGGVPRSMITNGDITTLNGIKVRFTMLTVNSKDNDGNEFSYNVPIVSEVITMPGEAEDKTEAKTEAKAEDKKGSDDGIVKKAMEVLTDLVKKAEGGKLALTALSTLGFNAIDNADPDKSEMLGMMFNPEITKDYVTIKDGVMTLK